VLRAGLVAGLDQQVLRLHVPVHQPQAVRGVQRPGRLAEQGDGGLRRQRPAPGDPLPQVPAGDEAHRDVQQPVAFPDVVDGDDVRVVHRGGDARFIEEAGAEDVVGGDLGRQHLQRDAGAEPRVLRLVHDAHGAAPDDGLQQVAGVLVADFRKLRHNHLSTRAFHPPLSRDTTYSTTNLDIPAITRMMRFCGRCRPAPGATRG
jgi:hypothetical protein